MTSPLQMLVDGMNAQAQKARADGDGLTLGEFITLLEARDPNAEVVGLGGLMSYRGYYCDLAFEPVEKPRTVADLLRECRAAVGATFMGYKGGDFRMGKTTPLWVSEYGMAEDKRLVGLTVIVPFMPITVEAHDGTA